MKPSCGSTWMPYTELPEASPEIIPCLGPTSNFPPSAVSTPAGITFTTLSLYELELCRPEPRLTTAPGVS